MYFPENSWRACLAVQALYYLLFIIFIIYYLLILLVIVCEVCWKASRVKCEASFAALWSYEVRGQVQSLQVWVETFDLFGAGSFVQDRDVVHYRVACYHDRGHDGDSSVRWWTAPILVLPNYRSKVAQRSPGSMEPKFRGLQGPEYPKCPSGHSLQARVVVGVCITAIGVA